MKADVKRLKRLTCECNFCGASLRFADACVGQAVNCLKCGMETILFVPGQEPPYSPDEYRLKAGQVSWRRSPYNHSRELVITLENLSNHDLDWARVEFILYNDQRRPVGSASDSLEYFPAKRQWTFHAPVCEDDARLASDPILTCEFGKVDQPGPLPAECPL
jgi:hypothetical protein